MSVHGVPPQWPQPGWYPDPDGEPALRYFDGHQWAPEVHAADPATGTYRPPMAVTPANTLATVSLVLGVVAAVIEWGGVLTLLAAILAIIFGAVGRSRAGRIGGAGKGR